MDKHLNIVNIEEIKQFWKVVKKKMVFYVSQGRNISTVMPEPRNTIM